MITYFLDQNLDEFSPVGVTVAKISSQLKERRMVGLIMSKTKESKITCPLLSSVSTTIATF